ncbi:hypothetical protein BJX70DRAFT_359419 [Aspergillus crustosus]
MKNLIPLSLSAILQAATATTHPGLLHTETDFTRIRTLLATNTEPQLTGWKKLTSHESPLYTPSAVPTICRGSSGECNSIGENYGSLYRDIVAAYANALVWKITGNETHSDAAAAILDDWSGTLVDITGSTDLYLAAGLYGLPACECGGGVEGV